MHTVNAAFDQLRELVPAYPSNRKLSKIDTLRLACSYIEDLTSLLSNPAIVHGEDVKLYNAQCHEFEGFLQQGCESPTGYQGVHVKSEFGDYCNYQHYRVQPSYISVSLPPHMYTGAYACNNTLVCTIILLEGLHGTCTMFSSVVHACTYSLSGLF